MNGVVGWCGSTLVVVVVVAVSLPDAPSKAGDQEPDDDDRDAEG